MGALVWMETEMMFFLYFHRSTGYYKYNYLIALKNKKLFNLVLGVFSKFYFVQHTKMTLGSLKLKFHNLVSRNLSVLFFCFFLLSYSLKSN
jgi:hypothetical protein